MWRSQSEAVKRAASCVGLVLLSDSTKAPFSSWECGHCWDVGLVSGFSKWWSFRGTLLARHFVGGAAAGSHFVGVLLQRIR